MKRARAKTKRRNRYVAVSKMPGTVPVKVPDLEAVEQEIDAAFANNPLKRVPWTQSVWTLLSVIEDHHFNIMVVHPLPEQQASAYVDGLINAMTHPLRVLHAESPRSPTDLAQKLVSAHYGYASEWLNAAYDYNHFCSIFPLYRAKEINLTVNGDQIKPTDWSKTDLSYETYDRLVGKRDPETDVRADINAIVPFLTPRIHISDGRYAVDFTPDLLKALDRHIAPAFRGRHVLPDDWQFSRFSLAQYRMIFVSLQAMLVAWFVARQLVVSELPALAYESSVWTPSKDVLAAMLAASTGLSDQIVRNVLEYLTFGAVGVRHPDAAIQPLFDLGNGHYGIAPFLLIHVHAERNLSVLLNQVAADRKLYADVVIEKEHRLRSETILSLKAMGLNFKHGNVDGTDIDLAIIDCAEKICLCIELKWFIEPAEIREVLLRSEELEKGVSQAKLLNALFVAKDARLFGLLGITDEYQFQAMVGSVTSVGRPGVQDPQIPITKLWHVVYKLKETRSLRMVVQWLRLRAYLPVRDRDFKVKVVLIRVGKWKSWWYGITDA